MSENGTDALLDLSFAREMGGSGMARALREAKRASLRDFATPVGCAPSTILRWERGDLRPTGQAGIRYARLLRELMTSTPKKHTPAVAGIKGVRDKQTCEKLPHPPGSSAN